jgi:hypothetical protein
VWASTSDADIATFDGTSVYGVSAGDTGTSANVEYALYILDPGNDCYPYGTNQASVYGSVNVAGTISLGSVSFTAPTPPVVRQNEEATLAVVIIANSVATSTRIGLQVTMTNASGDISVGIIEANPQPYIGSGLTSSSSTTVTVKFKPSTNPSSPVTFNGHVKLVKIQETPGDEVVMLGQGTAGEKDSSNQVTVQPNP